MRCPQCGRTFDADARLCAYDGALLVGGDDGRTVADLHADLRPGDTVGDYQIQSTLGQGGMGVVYGAVQPLIGKKVAIKLLSLEMARNREAIARFIQEARAVNQIGHRHIIDIFTFGQLPDGRHYFVMEYLEGLSLRQRIERDGPLSPHDAVAVLRDVARALDAAHAKGIVHRDLKPDNIFLSRDDQGEPRFVKLLDFGIAKLTGGDEAGALMRTRTGMVMGTPYYMSPEQCRGLGIDHRSDIYSLGVVAFQMLTGLLPFRGTSFSDLIVQHLSEPPPVPSEVSSRISPALNPPILRALEKDPAHRYQRAGDFAEALTLAVEGSIEDAATRLGRVLPGHDAGPRSTGNGTARGETGASALRRSGEGTPGSSGATAALAESETVFDPVAEAAGDKASGTGRAGERGPSDGGDRLGSGTSSQVNPTLAPPEASSTGARPDVKVVAATTGQVALAEKGAAEGADNRESATVEGGGPEYGETGPRPGLAPYVIGATVSALGFGALLVLLWGLGIFSGRQAQEGPADPPVAIEAAPDPTPVAAAPTPTPNDSIYRSLSFGTQPAATVGASRVPAKSILTPVAVPAVTPAPAGTGLVPLERKSGTSRLRDLLLQAEQGSGSGTGATSRPSTAPPAGIAPSSSAPSTTGSTGSYAKAILAAMEAQYTANDWKREAGLAYDRKDFARALECAEKALKIDPEMTEALLLMGKSACQVKNVQKARLAYIKLPVGESAKLMTACSQAGVSLL